MLRTCTCFGAVSVVGTILLSVSCSDNQRVSQENSSGSSSALGVPRLKVPAEYVLAPDGTTRQTLEQAGILKPDGRPWARVLGKALFWDQQAGSDGNACASCHYSAGADARIKNQLSSGLTDVAVGPNGDQSYGSTRSDTGFPPGRMPSGDPAGQNYSLKPGDFPLHQLTNKRDRNSPIHTTTNDVVSSQGSFDHNFLMSRRGTRPDRCTPTDNEYRQPAGRNTPTVINAAFFFSNFWDGRANNLFNGVGPFGLRDIQGDPNKRLIVLDGGVPKLDHIEVRNASLASQAAGPPISAVEMSCAGRTFADLGRKLLGSKPLFQQRVDKTDSLLGPFVSPSGKGLRPEHGYAALIKKAFNEKYWNANGKYQIVNGQLVQDLSGFTQMETNFPMFWSLAIMLYEQTLVSDQSRFDDWFESCRPTVTNPGGSGSQAVPVANPIVTCSPKPDNPNQSSNPTAHGLTTQEVLGYGMFNNGGVGFRNPGSTGCIACHPVGNPNAAPLVFPLFTEAAFQDGQTFVPVERSRIDDPGFPLDFALDGASHDRGFFNLGLRPVSDDLGAGAKDPYGNDLSLARMFLHEQAGESVIDPTGIGNRCSTPTIIEPGGAPLYPGCPSATPPPLDFALERQAVDGSFKTPSLRNVGLTPPYFHYGAYGDLRSVVEVYVRGGNKRNMRSSSLPDATGDWSGSGPKGYGAVPTTGPHYGTNVNFFIRDVKSTDEQIDALVAFMLTLTDARVQCDNAPFDHPELTIFNGHKNRVNNGTGHADDITFVLPAVGANGYAGPNARYCIPNAGDIFDPGMRPRRGE